MSSQRSRKFSIASSSTGSSSTARRQTMMSLAAFGTGGTEQDTFSTSFSRPRQLSSPMESRSSSPQYLRSGEGFTYTQAPGSTPRSGLGEFMETVPLESAPCSSPPELDQDHGFDDAARGLSFEVPTQLSSTQSSTSNFSLASSPLELDRVHRSDDTVHESGFENSAQSISPQGLDNNLSFASLKRRTSIPFPELGSDSAPLPIPLRPTHIEKPSRSLSTTSSVVSSPPQYESRPFSFVESYRAPSPDLTERSPSPISEKEDFSPEPTIRSVSPVPTIEDFRAQRASQGYRSRLATRIFSAEPTIPEFNTGGPVRGLSPELTDQDPSPESAVRTQSPTLLPGDLEYVPIVRPLKLARPEREAEGDISCDTMLYQLYHGQGVQFGRRRVSNTMASSSNTPRNFSGGAASPIVWWQTRTELPDQSLPPLPISSPRVRGSSSPAFPSPIDGIGSTQSFAAIQRQRDGLGLDVDFQGLSFAKGPGMMNNNSPNSPTPAGRKFPARRPLLPSHQRPGANRSSSYSNTSVSSPSPILTLQPRRNISAEQSPIFPGSPVPIEESRYNYGYAIKDVSQTTEAKLSRHQARKGPYWFDEEERRLIAAEVEAQRPLCDHDQDCTTCLDQAFAYIENMAIGTDTNPDARQIIIQNNRALRNIKNELEGLIERGVLTDAQYDTIMGSLPNESPLNGAASRSASTAPAPAPAPVDQMAQMNINNPPPSYSTTPAPAAQAAAFPPPPPRNATPQRPEISRAQARYRYAEAGDCTFEQGDQIAVYEHMNADWWMGKNLRTGQEGVFPASYVQVLPPQNGFYGDQKNAYPGQPQYAQGPPAAQSPYNSAVPPMAIAEGTPGENKPSKGEEMGKKFGKKLGNAAIFGAGASIGSNIVNSIM